jgi:hypothetical protein
VEELSARKDPETQEPLYRFDSENGRILGRDDKPLSRKEVLDLIRRYEAGRERGRMQDKLDALASKGALPGWLHQKLTRQNREGRLTQEQKERVEELVAQAGLGTEADGRLRATARESAPPVNAAAALTKAFDGAQAPALPRMGPRKWMGGALQAPARPLDGGDSWKGKLVLNWRSDMDRLDSTREHAKFIRDNRIAIQVSDDAARMRTTVAEYDDGKVYVNGVFMDLGRMTLMNDGLAEEKALRTLSLKTLPIVAHETRHGITLAKVEKATGKPFEAGLIEDELVSFMDQAKVAAEVREKYPEFDKHAVPFLGQGEENILKAWEGGPPDVEKHVRSLYRVASVSTMTGEQLRERYRALEEELRKLQTAVQSLKALRQTAKSDEEREGIDAMLARFPPEEVLTRCLQKAQSTNDFFADLGRADKLKAFFEKELAGLQRDWESPRWKAWRERRKTP